MEVSLEVRLDCARVKGVQVREPRNRLVEVHKALDDKVTLTTAVRAPLRGAVHECMVSPDIVRARAPLRWVRGHSAQEQQDTEAPADLVLLDVDARGPVPVVASNGTRRHFLNSNLRFGVVVLRSDATRNRGMGGS